MGHLRTRTHDYTRHGTVTLFAALPEKLQERCLAAPGLLAQIIVAKYCDHLPLYRREQPSEARQPA